MGATVQGACADIRRGMQARGRVQGEKQGRCQQAVAVPPQPQQDGLAAVGAGCSLSWIPPGSCCGAAALGSLQQSDYAVKDS